MHAAASPRIAVVGHVCVDVRARPVHALPARGQLVRADRIDAVVGGAIGNIGRALRPLGERAYAVCMVGDDAWGDLVESTLSTWADTRLLVRSAQAPTSATMVFVAPDGERSFIHAVGANAELAAHHVPITALAEDGVRHLHVGYALLLPALDGAPMEALLRDARGLGMTTSLDMTWDSTGRWMDAIGPLLAHVDVFCPNNDEAEALTGHADPERAARALLDAGVRRMAVVTCGARGCVAAVAPGSGLGAEPQQGSDSSDGGDIARDTARDVDVFTSPARSAHIVDATGAGDCFNGALLAALLRGQPARAAVALASGAAVEALQAGPLPAPPGPND